MTVYSRAGSFYYRFWRHGTLYERGGHPSKRAAQDGEWARRREVGALRPRDQAVAPRLLVHDAVTRYGKDVVPSHKNAIGERYTFAQFVTRLGDRRLDTLTSADLEDYARWRLATPSGHGRPLSSTTVNRDLAHLSAFFSWCQGQGYVPEGFNPARARRRNQATGGVKRHDEPWRPWIILTPAQRRRLFRSLPDALWRTVGAKAELRDELGVRGGVIRDLRWERIDWPHRLLQVWSKRQNYVIPLSDRAVAILKKLGPQPTGPVFPVRTDSTFKKWWARVRADLGLTQLRPHDLRVGFVRRKASEGVDLRTVQDLGGWTSLAMVQRYSPTSLGAMRQAVGRREIVGTGRRKSRSRKDPPAD